MLRPRAPMRLVVPPAFCQYYTRGIIHTGYRGKVWPYHRGQFDVLAVAVLVDCLTVFANHVKRIKDVSAFRIYIIIRMMRDLGKTIVLCHTNFARISKRYVDVERLWQLIWNDVEIHVKILCFGDELVHVIRAVRYEFVSHLPRISSLLPSFSRSVNVTSNV